MNLLNLNEDNYETDIDDLFDVNVYIDVECDRKGVYSGLYGLPRMATTASRYAEGIDSQRFVCHGLWSSEVVRFFLCMISRILLSF